MTETARNPNKRRIVLLLWILLAFFYSFLTYDYIVAGNKDKKLVEYLQYVVQVCGNDHRPAKEVRALVLVKADELSLTLHGDQVTITGNGETLKIGVAYAVDIRLPIFHQTIYRKPFQHEVAYRIKYGRESQ